MKNKNFLITSVSTKVLLVKALKSACDLYNVQLIGSDLHENNAGLYFAHQHILLPRLNDNNYLTTLLEVCQNKNIGFIIPTRDEDLLYFSKHENVLNENNISICQSPLTTIEICNNKFLFRQFCEEKGFSIPKHYTSIKDIIYPCVVKREYSSASDGVFIVKEQKKLQEMIKQYGDNLIIEPFINYKEYSVDAFFDINGTFIEAVPRERLMISNGEAKVSKTVKSATLVKLVQELGKKLKFIGHIVVQVFYNNEHYYLIEINPRFGGASNLSIKAGLDSPNWLVSMMLDNKYQLIQTKDICYNLKMLRYSEDLFIHE